MAPLISSVSGIQLHRHIRNCQAQFSANLAGIIQKSKQKAQPQQEEEESQTATLVVSALILIISVITSAILLRQFLESAALKLPILGNIIWRRRTLRDKSTDVSAEARRSKASAVKPEGYSPRVERQIIKTLKKGKNAIVIVPNKKVKQRLRTRLARKVKLYSLEGQKFVERDNALPRSRLVRENQVFNALRGTKKILVVDNQHTLGRKVFIGNLRVKMESRMRSPKRGVQVLLMATPEEYARMRREQPDHMRRAETKPYAETFTVKPTGTNGNSDGGNGPRGTQEARLLRILRSTKLVDLAKRWKTVILKEAGGTGPAGTTAPSRRGPGATPRPGTTNPAGSKLSLAEITALLPRAHKEHAAAVKAVMDGTPQLYLCSPATRDARVRALAVSAHQRRIDGKNNPVGHQAALLKTQKAENKRARRQRLLRQRALQEHNRRMMIIQRQRRLRKGVIPL